MQVTLTRPQKIKKNCFKFARNSQEKSPLDGLQNAPNDTRACLIFLFFLPEKDAPGLPYRKWGWEWSPLTFKFFPTGLQVITKNTGQDVIQSKLEANTCNWLGERENVRERVTIGFSSVLLLFGWEGSASFLSQLQSTVMQNRKSSSNRSKGAQN